MRVFYSPHFLRSFEKLPRGIQDEFRAREIIFKKNLFDPRLKTHKLKGRDEWSFLVTYKIRAIFLFRKDIVILANVGDHSIYRNK